MPPFRRRQRSAPLEATPPVALPPDPEAELEAAEALASECLGGREESWLDAQPTIDAETAAWAALGALELGRLPQVRRVLERLLQAQRADGSLPVTLRSGRHPMGKLVNWLKRVPRPSFPGKPSFSRDAIQGARAHALVTWACAEFTLRTGDAELAQRWRKPLEAAIDWIERHARLNPPDVGLEALYHQAQIALGHLSIASGDAVAGARRWAAAAAAKERIQDAERTAGTSIEDLLLVALVSACDARTRDEALSRGDLHQHGGVMAWVAAQAGLLAEAETLLRRCAQTALAHGGFQGPAGAAQFLRGLSAWKRLAESCRHTVTRPRHRQWQLSEDDLRILSVC
ncbi:MAG: hypothetical protein VKP62_01890 [Candidatus Sericytochromatia bacterium]|nr:hypothetical protein [Candidatus Sericytochromatia bacterium]